MPRLWLGWAACAGLWVCWFVSMGMGTWLFDRFGQLYAMDHLAFYTAGRIVNEGRDGDLYDYGKTSQYQETLFPDAEGNPRWTGLEAFRNPPFYALPYTVTSRLSYAASVAIWQVIALGCLILGVRLLQPERPWRSTLWALSLYPVFCVFSYGQNSLLSFLAFCGTYRLLKEDRPFLAGLAASFLWFKPTLLFGLFVWWLFDWRKKWPCFVGVVAGGVFLTLGSYPIVPNAWHGFVDSLRSNLAFDNFPWAKCHTPRAFFRVLVPNWPRELDLPVLVVFAALATWVFYRLWIRRRDDLPIVFGGAVALTLWASAHALIYEYALLAITGILWWEHAPHLRPRWVGLFALTWGVMFVVTDLNVKIEEQLKERGYLPVIFQFSVPFLAWAGWRAVEWMREPFPPVGEAARPIPDGEPAPAA
jgi:alpha-1,2-mannosyltransferase